MNVQDIGIILRDSRLEARAKVALTSNVDVFPFYAMSNSRTAFDDYMIFFSRWAESLRRMKMWELLRDDFPSVEKWYEAARIFNSTSEFAYFSKWMYGGRIFDLHEYIACMFNDVSGERPDEEAVVDLLCDDYLSHPSSLNDQLWDRLDLPYYFQAAATSAERNKTQVKQEFETIRKPFIHLGLSWFARIRNTSAQWRPPFWAWRCAIVNWSRFDSYVLFPYLVMGEVETIDNVRLIPDVKVKENVFLEPCGVMLLEHDKGGKVMELHDVGVQRLFTGSYSLLYNTRQRSIRVEPLRAAQWR